MKTVLKMVSFIGLAAVVATPTFAANSRKHVRHHAYYNSYNQAPERPVFFNGRMIGRANDENIRIQMQNDESLKYR